MKIWPSISPDQNFVQQILIYDSTNRTNYFGNVTARWLQYTIYSKLPNHMFVTIDDVDCSSNCFIFKWFYMTCFNRIFRRLGKRHYILDAQIQFWLFILKLKTNQKLWLNQLLYLTKYRWQYCAKLVKTIVYYYIAVCSHTA